MSAENLLRELAPSVLAATLRRFGDFSTAEDAVQEALLAAAMQWPAQGMPANPRGWLIQVAARRMTDHLRTELARRRRQAEVVMEDAAEDVAGERDDTLVLLFMCCHPSLTPSSAIALTLRAVAGLTTAEIAAAFLVPEATMAQRISRAKAKIKASGVPFAMPMRDERPERLAQVLHVLYLVFNEGYATSGGPSLLRSDLANEAIRLTRAVHLLLPEDPEVTGLLALMLLTDARRDARATPDGEIIPLDEQDRTRWDRSQIAEGVALITDALPRGAVGPYQLQAAIAAVHDEAERADATDWAQILALYTVLERVTPSPVVTLNRAVAVAMVHGPAAGLAALAPLERDEHLAASHRLDAVRAHLHEMAGDREAARACYEAAARRTTSTPEKNYLMMRAARLIADL